MLNPKFQDHRISGSREEDFLSFLPYIGIGAILVIYTNVCSTFPRRLYIKFGFDWPSGLGEDVLKIADRRTEGRQGYSISSPCEPNGSGEPSHIYLA